MFNQKTWKQLLMDFKNFCKVLCSLVLKLSDFNKFDNWSHDSKNLMNLMECWFCTAAFTSFMAAAPQLYFLKMSRALHLYANINAT